MAKRTKRADPSRGSRTATRATDRKSLRAESFPVTELPPIDPHLWMFTMLGKPRVTGRRGERTSMTYIPDACGDWRPLSQADRKRKWISYERELRARMLKRLRSGEAPSSNNWACTIDGCERIQRELDAIERGDADVVIQPVKEWRDRDFTIVEGEVRYAADTVEGRVREGRRELLGILRATPDVRLLTRPLAAGDLCRDYPSASTSPLAATCHPATEYHAVLVRSSAPSLVADATAALQFLEHALLFGEKGDVAAAERSIGEARVKMERVRIERLHQPLSLDPTRNVVRYDGVEYALTVTQFRLISRIVRARPGWVSGPELKGNAASDERPDRVVRRLPTELRDLLEISGTGGSGYRLREFVAIE